MKHNVEYFKKYYVNATKEEVIEDMFLDCCEQAKEIERLQRQKEELQINGLRQETLFKLEIERLNNIINKAIDFLRENACIDEDVEYFCDDLRYDDCKKLLEILKGSDKE